MKCWHCQTELIWGGDHDIEDWKSEEYCMETNLSCPECASLVIVYMAVQGENDSSADDKVVEIGNSICL